MSYKLMSLRGPGTRAIRIYCDCADSPTEHEMVAQLRDESPREDELLAIVIRCADCGETQELDR